MPELHAFESAYAQWISARAALAKTDTDDGVRDDEAVNALLDKEKEAEWRLIEAPAADLEQIRMRAMAVQQMFNDADFGGPPTDNRHRIMLYRLVSDILRYVEKSGEPS
jgi:hypothetical protein